MKLILALGIAFCAQSVRAAGSVELSALRPILHQKPALEMLLTQTLQVDPDGLGVRLGHQFEHLSGLRVGPYDFTAKPRGAAGPATLAITICTHATFLDDGGAAMKKIESATSVREEVTSVIVREAGAKGFATCPE